MVQQGSRSLATSEFPLPTNPYPTSVLEQDPDSTEARKALDETFAFISKRDSEEDESVAEDVVGPSLTDPGKYYNRDGCTRGVECEFSHAPDYKSVRDRLSRNVSTMIKKEHRTQAQAPPAPRSKRTQYPSSKVIDPANVADAELRSHKDAINARRLAAAAEAARGQDTSHTIRSRSETSGLDNQSLAPTRTPQTTVASSPEPPTTSKRANLTIESDGDSGDHNLIRHRSKKSRNSIVVDKSDKERHDASQTRKLPKPGSKDALRRSDAVDEDGFLVDVDVQSISDAPKVSLKD
ncbi:hypothetical protein EDB86DRAFT_3075517 [Lactarius hatsudake]|nr:hypothetical protein EDB86DRAFT_3075517 [Lactarius hatsudake]